MDDAIFLKSKYTDCQLLFFPFVTQIVAGLASKKELILIIDGTDLGKSCGALLVSLALAKRSLSLVCLVKKGNKGQLTSLNSLKLGFLWMNT